MGITLLKNTPTIAVTGATGLIGRHVISQLLQHNCNIRALSRQSQNNLIGVEVINSDLFNESGLEKLLKSVDVLIHCAGEISDPTKMEAVNVDATMKLANSAVEQGVKVFCHLSSAGVIGESCQNLIDESTPCSPKNTYEKTKMNAEQGLQDSGILEKMRLYILRPTNVVDKASPGLVGQMMDLGWQNRLRFILKGRECAHLIHAADVASAAIHLALSDTDLSGTYFVGCDEDERNTVSGTLELCRRKISKLSWFDKLYLPAGLIYWIRSITKGWGIHGRTRFSSAKLLKTGFSFPIGFEGIFEVICNSTKSKFK